MNPIIEKLRKDGYPYRIIGIEGYEGVLCDMQTFSDGEYCAVYRYPGDIGKCCHFLDFVKACSVLEW